MKDSRVPKVISEPLPPLEDVISRLEADPTLYAEENSRSTNGKSEETLDHLIARSRHIAAFAKEHNREHGEARATRWLLREIAKDYPEVAAQLKLQAFEYNLGAFSSNISDMPPLSSHAYNGAAENHDQSPFAKLFLPHTTQDIERAFGHSVDEASEITMRPKAPSNVYEPSGSSINHDGNRYSGASGSIVDSEGAPGSWSDFLPPALKPNPGSSSDGDVLSYSERIHPRKGMDGGGLSGTGTATKFDSTDNVNCAGVIENVLCAHSTSEEPLNPRNVTIVPVPDSTNFQVNIRMRESTHLPAILGAMGIEPPIPNTAATSVMWNPGATEFVITVPQKTLEQILIKYTGAENSTAGARESQRKRADQGHLMK